MELNVFCTHQNANITTTKTIVTHLCSEAQICNVHMFTEILLLKRIYQFAWIVP
jgi:hypothetical protein